jgi:putative phage-type endonuclease
LQLVSETMIEQRTAEWHQQRLGKVTASRVGDATAKLKGNGWAAPRANYLMQLVVERLTGDPAPFFANDAMRWGTDTEPYARLAYSACTGRVVEEVGFIAHPTIAMSGASADGLVGDDGMIEMKCPTTSTHIKTLLGEPIDADYVKQMHWNLACRPTRKWCDFVSYDPRLPAELQLFIRRFERDDVAIAALESDIRTFLGEVDAKIAALMALAGEHIPF